MKTPGERIKKYNERSNLMNFLGIASRFTFELVKIPYEIPLFITAGKSAITEFYEENHGRITPAAKQSRELADMLDEDKSAAIGMGVLAGMGLGICLDVAQIGAYGYLAFNGHSEALIIPLVTNVLSGAYEIGKRFFRKREPELEKEEKQREIDELASQLEKAVTFGLKYQMLIQIPSANKESFVYMTYMCSDPPTIKVETCWSQPEALRPEYHGKKDVEFKEGEKYLDDVFTEEMIGILEQRLASEKGQGIRRNLRRPATNPN